MIGAAATGFFTAFSLILAIGAQNAFILRQGILRSHIFALALFCAISDAILIAVGVVGFGAIVTFYPLLPIFMSLFGSTFLFLYGAIRLRKAWQGDYTLELAGQSMALRPALGIVFACTWLNPHVYLDTIALIGAVSTQYTGGDKIVFGIAASTASFIFFFGLGYGARILAPIMQTPFTWRVLDIIICCIMWVIAIELVQRLGG
jgi:L-lysine exporter family protein LysE/ArgO